MESTDPGDGVEILADDGISRRVFCGAAATDDGNSDVEYVPPKETDTDYGHQKVVDTYGGLELYVGMKGEYKTSVTVSSHTEGIGLPLSNEIGAMSVLLLPEDNEPFCRELLDEREKTRRTMSNTRVSGSPKTTGKVRTMQTSDARMTACVVRTEDRETSHEYEVGGVSYLSAEAVEAR